MTPKKNKGQNTLSKWEYIKLIEKNNVFDPLLKWMNRHCGCLELAEYIPFHYLHVAFGVRIKML